MADHMGISETDEKVVKKGVLDALRSVFVKKNLLRFVYSRGLDRKALENDAESLILGDLFDMESLKDIAGRKMVENLNIDSMVKFFLVRERYRAERLWMMAKISSNVTFENRKRKKDGISQ